MLINEKKLNMMNAYDHRTLLQAEMVKYLFEEGEVQIEGYVPPASRNTATGYRNGTPTLTAHFYRNGTPT